jgi:phosphohistidine phosphatase
MDLYLIRHAAAESAGENGTDAVRPLTRRGAERFAAGIAGLERLGVRLDEIVHSPLLRAVGTADLLTPLLRGSSRVSAYVARAPGPEILGELRGERVALVGHQPWLSELAAWLTLGGLGENAGGTSETTPGAKPSLHLGKGSVAWLRGRAEPGAMVLRGLFTPRMLRKLGR